MTYDSSLPVLGAQLSDEQKNFIQLFTKSCKRTILQMVKQSQSGHPGGSLSSLDILAMLYTGQLRETHEPMIVSNGHISPGVYSVLAEMGTIPKQEVIDTFRVVGSHYEGHVTRHVKGVYFGTGPLGVGVSAAAGMAWAEKKNGTGKHVWALMGDGEAQEGQVHEMALYAAKEKLNNFTVFVDYNEVQLTDSLEAIMPINLSGIFAAHGWNVLEIDGHDLDAIWGAIDAAQKSDKPTAVIAQTVMGYGVEGMEEAGRNKKSDWHGKTPKPDQADEMVETLDFTEAEEAVLEEFRAGNPYDVETLHMEYPGRDMGLDTGTPAVYPVDKKMDCRSAYGNALLDLAERNKEIIASSADLMGSVKTNGVAKNLPDQYTEFGICEQHMVSACGGMSLRGVIPFCSTFGAFMTSRAKDQARVNDINLANVKMVATHCGLSVGKDGPTHQAIDDMGSMQGLFHTKVLEPADPNQCDRMVRYIANVWGNAYMRMGRHKLNILTKEDGTPYYDENYVYEYGKVDVYRAGSAVTLVVAGSLVEEAVKSYEMAGVDAEIVIATSPKKFSDELKTSLQKTKKVIVVEDHNRRSGYGAAVALYAAQNGIGLEGFESIAVQEYQLSGEADELYGVAGVDHKAIAEALKKMA